MISFCWVSHRPALLMLDEPSIGLSPLICAELYEQLAVVKRSGVSILLVEHNAYYGLALADRCYVLANGRIVREGDSATIGSDDLIAQSYLGV